MTDMTDVENPWPPGSPMARETEAAIEARQRARDHADLRLRFALALAPAFPDLALASARAHNTRGDDFSAVSELFELADACAAEDARRRREEGP